MDTVDLKLSLNSKGIFKIRALVPAALISPGLPLFVFLMICGMLAQANVAASAAEPGSSSSSSLPAATSSPASAAALPGVPAQMQELEKELFFTTFDDDSVEDRLSRLENKVFGTTRDGTVEQRILALQNVVLKARKSGSLAGGYQPPSPPLQFQPPAGGSSLSPDAGMGGAPASSGFSTGGSSTGSSSSGNSKSVFFDESAQQRLAIQAARDEEINAVMQEGTQLFRAKKYDQARSRFEQVLRLDPANAQANYSLGVILEASGQLQEARTAYMAAYGTNPSNPDFRDAVAAIDQKYQQAAQKNDAANRSKQLNESALEAFKRGDYYSAIDMYKQLDTLEPDQPLIKYNMGTIYLMMKDPQNALLNFKAAYTLKPNDARFEKSFKELDKQMKKAGGVSGTQPSVQGSQGGAGYQQMPNTGQQQPMQGGPVYQQMPNMGQQQPVMQGGPGYQQMPNMGQQQPMVQGGQVPYGYNQSGVPPAFQNSSLQQKRQDLMFQYGIVGKAASDGVQVTNVLPGSRAARAGVAAGDLIRAVGSEEVYEPWQVNRVLQRIPYRQDIPVLYQRNGELRTGNM